MTHTATPHHQSPSLNSAPARHLLIRPQVNDPSNSKSLVIPRTKRRRGRRSCNSCRQRRMKCNADAVWPCYGCKKYGVECHFRDESKPTDPIEFFEDRIARLENLLDRKLHQRALDKRCALAKKPRPSCSSGENDIYPYQKILCGCNGLVSANATSELIEQVSMLQLNDFGTTRYLGSSSGLNLLSPFDPSRSYRINDQRLLILQKLNHDNEELVIVKVDGDEKPRPLVTQSITVLQDVPGLTEELIDLAIHGYFMFIQPNIPILNKLSFLQQYYYHNPHPPDEYMLSAMCAIGMDFLNFQDGQVVGTDIGRDAVRSIKRALGDKATNILQIAHRRSQINTLQTLIMLTIFLATSSEAEDEDEEDSIQWITTGIAINMAQNLGLHRSSTDWNLPKSEIELRRRIWYAVYTMDAWIAAELGRPLAISDETFDVDLPSVYEIESPYHTVSDNESTAMDYPLLISQAEACLREKSPEYRFFIQMTLLSHTLRKILCSLYSPIVHDTSQNTVETIEALDAELCTWKSSVPVYLQFEERAHDVSSCDNGILFIFYNCIKLLLHRPILESKDAIGTVSATRSQHVCTLAAINIIDMIETFLRTVSDYIPRSIVGYSVFQAAAIFVFNISSKNEHERHLGHRNLARCAAAYAVNGANFRSARIVNQFAKMLADTHMTKEITCLPENGTNDDILTHTFGQQRTEIPHHTLLSTSPEALFYSSLPHQIVSPYNLSHINKTQNIQHRSCAFSNNFGGNESSNSIHELSSTRSLFVVDEDGCPNILPSLLQNHTSVVDPVEVCTATTKFSFRRTIVADDSIESSSPEHMLASEIAQHEKERIRNREVCSPIDFSLALWGLYDTF